MSKFKDKVIEVVKIIPYGYVVSYGQVALMCGVPRAARQVGWILNGLEGEIQLPWWRVVNNQGRVSIKGSKYSALDQKMLLEKEGINISNDLTFDIEKHRFRPSVDVLKKFELDDDYISILLEKYLY
ncbi:MAG: MGMT family protein [Patescibacteria group bacterium]